MSHPSIDSRSLAIVLGCGDVGSAVALALHVSGLSVVLVDEVDPAWHRRGMAFTDAWYLGHADLGGESACFCASVKSIPSVLGRRLIAATTWSWPGVANAMKTSVLVDALGFRRRGAESLRGRVPFTIGIGPGFSTGENVDVAIELPAEMPPHDGDIRSALWPPGNAGSATQGAGNRVAEATRNGRFITDRRIGDAVRAGDIVGRLGNTSVIAPCGGVLLGLAARGARIEAGDTLVEVDPLGASAQCHGLDRGARTIAARVRSTLARLTTHAVLLPAEEFQD